MHWQYTPYTVPIFIGGIISGALAVLAWRRRPVTGTTAFALMMLAVAEWSLGYAMELAAVDLPTKILWAQVQYLGIVTVPVMWLYFALQYTGWEKWLTRRNLVLLAIGPLVTLLLTWSNKAHGLIWSDIGLDTSGPFPMLDLAYGAWFWVHSAYAYLLLLLGTFLFIHSLIHSPQLYRGQTGALLVGVFAPWVGNGLYLSGLNPFPHLDLTPFAFTVTGLAVSWSLFRYRMLDIVPVARSVIIESMRDGVIVLDSQNRVVDLNPAAQALIGYAPSNVIGQPLSQFLTAWPNLIELCREAADGIHTEITLNTGEEGQRVFDLNVSPLRSRHGQLTGRLMILRDVTERRRAEAQVRLLLTLTRSISTAPDLATALHTALRLIVEHTGWIFGEAWLPNEERGELENSGKSYYRGEHVDRLRRFDLASHEFTFAPGAGLPGRVWASGQLEWQQDISSLPPQVYRRVQHGMEAGLMAALGVPVLVGEQVLAVLVFYMAEPRTEDQRLVELVSAVTVQLGATLQYKQGEETRQLQVAALNAAANGIVITDRDGAISWVNPAFTTLTGYGAAEAIGQNPRLLKSGQHSLVFYEQLWETLLAGQTWHGEIANRRQDGSTYIEEQSITPVRDRNGEIAHFISIKQDVTARKEIEEKLRNLLRAVEYSASTIVITDLEGNIEFVNSAFTRITGYTLDQALGQNPRILKSGKHGPEFYRELWATITQGGVWRGEMVNLKKNGELYWEAATISPVKDEDGRITHYIAVKEDITARKKAEETLQQYAAELEMRNTELDAFAHTVAHDLKNPLTAVVGYSTLLQIKLNELPDDQKRDFLKKIEQSGNRMNSIVDELLLLASVREMEEIEIRPLNMEKIVAEVQERAEYMIEEYQAEIVTLDSWPVALGYGPWVEEVWVNYVSNALKYGGQPPRVELGAMAERDQVRFWVRDNGAGLSSEEQARLFTPFERLHQVSAQGHGLGLSIVQRIVEKLGGQVGVESEQGQGSTFYFTLPGAESR